MVGIIQDELERMIAKVNTAKIICDSDCSRCVGDERLYYGLGMSRSNQRYACPVGYGLAERSIGFALENPSGYQSLILSESRNLQRNSIENTNPVKIQSDLSLLGTYLSEQKKQESMTTHETSKLSESVILPELESLNISRISFKARNLLRDNHFNLSLF